MLKRWFAILVLLLISATGVSAQDGGSTLQAWADTPASALNISTQVEWPSYQSAFGEVSSYGATGDPAPGCVSGHSYSLWHTFIAPQTGWIGVWGSGTNFDTVVTVYKTSPTAANAIACFNGSSAVNVWDGEYFKAVAGTRYYVMFAAVGSGMGVTGDSLFRTLYYGNNAALSAYQIPASGAYTNLQDHIERAGGTFSPTGTCPQHSYSVYYKFRPTRTGVYEFSTLNSSYDTVIMVTSFSGSFIGCNDNLNANTRNSRLRVTLTAGTSYYLTIGQSNSAAPMQSDNMSLSLRVRRL